MSASRWTIGLPYERPPLSLNYHLTRPHENRVTGEVRAVGCQLARAARIGRHARVAVELHWRPASGRTATRDTENPVPTLKALCDGLVDAGVVPDDDRWRMTKVMPIIHDPEPPAPGLMWLEVVLLPELPDAPPPMARPTTTAGKKRRPGAGRGGGRRQAPSYEPTSRGAAEVRTGEPSAWSQRVAETAAARKAGGS